MFNGFGKKVQNTGALYSWIAKVRRIPNAQRLPIHQTCYPTEFFVTYKVFKNVMYQVYLIIYLY